MDFLTRLSISEQFVTLLVIVDWVFNMHYLKQPNKTANIKGVAWMYLNNILKLHGLPQAIVLDWGPWFTSSLWTELCSYFKVQKWLLMIFWTETDRQTEWAIAVLKQYLPSYILYPQDDKAS